MSDPGSQIGTRQEPVVDGQKWGEFFELPPLEGGSPSCAARAAGLVCSCDALVQGGQVEFYLAEPAVCPWASRLSVARGVEDRFGHRAVIVTLDPEPKDALTRARVEYLVGPSFEAAEATARALTAGMTPVSARDVTGWLLARWRVVATREAVQIERDAIVDRDNLQRRRAASRDRHRG